jgi:hypothetical protein
VLVSEVQQAPGRIAQRKHLTIQERRARYALLIVVSRCCTGIEAVRTSHCVVVVLQLGESGKATLSLDMTQQDTGMRVRQQQ